MRFFDVPMPFNGEILHVEMLVKEFRNPDATGHRIYTLQAVEIATPASKRSPVRLGFPNLAEHPPAGVSDRFAQMVKIVKAELDQDDIRNENDTLAFGKWFGNSKAVDENGKPDSLYK